MFPDDHRYDNIIEFPRPESRRPKMPRSDRAARFAPFSALPGLEDALGEAARSPEPPRRRQPDPMALADRRLRKLEEHVDERPSVTISFYIPDARGCPYETVSGPVRRVCMKDGVVVLGDGRTIRTGDVISVDGALYDGDDETCDF